MDAVAMDESDITEAEFDRMFAEGEPVEIVRHPLRVPEGWRVTEVSSCYYVWPPGVPPCDC